MGDKHRIRPPWKATLAISMISLAFGMTNPTSAGLLGGSVGVGGGIGGIGGSGGASANGSANVGGTTGSVGISGSGATVGLSPDVTLPDVGVPALPGQATNFNNKPTVLATKCQEQSGSQGRLWDRAKVCQ